LERREFGKMVVSKAPANKKINFQNILGTSDYFE